MRNVYDPDGSRELLKLLQAAEDHCDEIWSQLKTNSEISQVRTVCDVSCLMDEYESRLYANKKRLEGLIADAALAFGRARQMTKLLPALPRSHTRTLPNPSVTRTVRSRPRSR